MIKGILPAKRYDAILKVLKAGNNKINENIRVVKPIMDEMKLFTKKYYRAFPQYDVENEMAYKNIDKENLTTDLNELSFHELLVQLRFENYIMAFYQEEFHLSVATFNTDYENHRGIFEVKQSSIMKQELSEAFVSKMNEYLSDVEKASELYLSLSTLVKEKHGEVLETYS